LSTMSTAMSVRMQVISAVMAICLVILAFRQRVLRV